MMKTNANKGITPARMNDHLYDPVLSYIRPNVKYVC